MRGLWLVLLAGCTLDNQLQATPDGSQDGPRDDTEAWVADSADTADTALVEDTGTAGDTPEWPAAGTLVITELMINPSAVGDEAGEWVELRSTSEAWLDLTRIELGDLGVDRTYLDADDRLLAPGSAWVICAEEADNGGVSCDATFPYSTWGGGFAMSNGEDEVVLYQDGVEIDRVTWSDGFAPTGASIALDPRHTDPDDNDRAANWCTQDAELSGGDNGTPGEPNERC